jgi:ABC-type multidrug transport system ATPase subunit
VSALLEVRGIRKRLGGRWVLDGVSLDWAGPGVIAIAGENGAGKSTLLRVVAGILAADEGTVSIAGAPLQRRREIALGHLGYAPDLGELPPYLTTSSLVALVASLKRAARPSPALIERLGVAPFLDQPLGSLSLGQRRRASLLAALTGEPDLLVVDEPTNGLDAEGRAMLVALLREREAAGGASLVATHDGPFIEAIARECHELARGKLSIRSNPRH